MGLDFTFFSSAFNGESCEAASFLTTQFQSGFILKTKDGNLALVALVGAGNQLSHIGITEETAYRLGLASNLNKPKQSISLLVINESSLELLVNIHTF